MYTALRYLVIAVICLAAWLLGKNYIRQFREAEKLSNEQMDALRKKKESFDKALYEQDSGEKEEEAGQKDMAGTDSEEKPEERSE